MGVEIKTILMAPTNSIGIDKEASVELQEGLDVLLANFQIYYQNLRGLHWNIRGRNFFQLHVKFEELYNDAQLKVDEVAERILTLGGTPSHTYSSYVKMAKIEIGENIKDDEPAVQLVHSNLVSLIEIERPLIAKAAELGDEGTADMITGFMGEQEKTAWMFRSWLG